MVLSTRSRSLQLAIAAVVATASSVTAQSPSGIDVDARLFQFEPDTPTRFVRAASTAAEYDRDSLARGYLQQLIRQNLSPEELLQLRREVGAALLLRLNANPDLRPYAHLLLQQVNAASTESVVSVEQAERLIGRLGTGHRETMDAASSLLAIGNPAVPVLLATDATVVSGQLARELLGRHLRLFQTGLMDSLPVADPATQVLILNLLQNSVNLDLAPHLLSYEFSHPREDVREAARVAVGSLWFGPDRPETAAEAAMWLSGRAAQILTESSDPFSRRASQETLVNAIRMAGDAIAIDSRKQRTSAVLLACCAAVDAAAVSGVDLSDRAGALEVALDAGNGPSVVALLNQNPASLRRAIVHPDAIVRVPAAVRLLESRERVRGRQLAAEIVAAAAQAREHPEAVVIDSRAGQARLIAPLVGDVGYDAAVAFTGQAGFDAAVSGVSCELILVHTNCLRWPLSQTVANLRADARTHRTPIVVYGALRNAESVERLRACYSGVWYLPEPLSDISFRDELRLAGVPGPRLDAESRLALIDQAASVSVSE